jgi:predicted transcriptional regulator
MKGAPKLGPLELLVIDQLWRGGAQDVAGMHRSVGAQRGVSRNTIHSTLERLVRKGLAGRRKVGRAYEYRATRSRSEWVADSLTALLRSVPGSDPGALIASFVDVAEQTGDDALETLERLVRERRQSRSGDE